jgi:hypothetical protein
MAVFQDRNESVEVYRDDARNRIVVAPYGHWTMTTARPTIEEFFRLLQGSAHFVGDIRVLGSYESAVRKAWQGAFSSTGKNILSFTFVGRSTPLVRMGVGAMSLYLGLSFRSVDALEGLRPAHRGGALAGSETAP